jgi:hypothetical protein
MHVKFRSFLYYSRVGAGAASEFLHGEKEKMNWLRKCCGECEVWLSTVYRYLFPPLPTSSGG